MLPENLSPLWILPGILLVITVLLLIYWLILTVAPVRERQEAGAKASPTPSTPVQAVQNPVVLTPPPAANPYMSTPPAYPSAPPAYSQPPTGYPSPAPAAPVSGLGSITVLSGAPPQDIPLPGPQFAIGRFFAAEQGVLVGLDEKSISRRHAMIRANPATREFFLQDGGSSYGTIMLVEGRMDKLTPNVETKLYNGDIVQLGNAVRIRFNLPNEMRSSATQL